MAMFFFSQRERKIKSFISIYFFLFFSFAGNAIKRERRRRIFLLDFNEWKWMNASFFSPPSHDKLGIPSRHTHTTPIFTWRCTSWKSLLPIFFSLSASSNTPPKGDRSLRKRESDFIFTFHSLFCYVYLNFTVSHLVDDFFQSLCQWYD